MQLFTTLVATALLSGHSAQAANLTQSVPWADVAVSAPSKGRYLYRTESQEPMLWVSDTNWELVHRLNKTDVDLYLADRAAKGFTVVQTVLLSKLNATTIPNFNGDLPLGGPNHDDPMQPNDAYFEYVDWVIARAAEYGILVCLLPSWSRYVNGGWFDGPYLFNETSAESYGRYLGRRYPGIPKMLGGDTNAFWIPEITTVRAAWRENTTQDPTALLCDMLGPNPVQDTRYLWAAMFCGIKDEEAKRGYDAFLLYHPTSPWVSDPPTPLPYGHNYINGSFGTLSMDAVQSGHEVPSPDDIDNGFKPLHPWDSTRNYECTIAMRSAFPGPVVDVENHYEATHIAFNTSRPMWNSSNVRHGFYPALLSGAAGVTYGSLSVQQSYENPGLSAKPLDAHYIAPQLELSANASWHEGLHLPGAKQTGYVHRLFDRLPRSRETWESLRPDRSFIGNGTGVLGFEAERYVAGMIADDTYWVYAGYGDSFELDLSGIAAAWRQPGAIVGAQWLYPRTGKWLQMEGGKFVAEGKKRFAPPSSGGVDFDWALEIKVVNC